ncbi:3'-5' exoribonuclease HELZ2-like [Ptychodera flava]|uniref:3'-5' exoribonuclease HELZ2-like n=1 Tax=Ptychodera flava TaxID=63121 RepID=UPI00396A2627
MRATTHVPFDHQSRAKLSYEDAENVINGVQGTIAIPHSVQESIDILHRLTCKLQANRLGDGQFCCRYESNDVAISPQAHSMVEELMLLANMQVASLLVSVFPNCTPLRRQKSPREDKLTDWKTKHRSQIPNSLDIVAKSELLQLQEFLQSEQAGDVDVLNTTWGKIVVAIQVDDTVELRKLLLNDLNHPQLAIMSTHYRQIQERAIYIASNNTSDERSHFSLNVTEYTHFTSPIRRYIDIIVHRLVIAYLTSQDSPYSEVNIKEICDNCNQQAAFAKEFERATMALHVATTLGENPTQTLAFISSTTDGSVELHVPEYNMQIPASERTINFSALQPCQKPVIQDENTPVTLEWKQRIYTNGEDIQYDVLNARRNDLLARRDSTPTLSPERYVKHIPGSMWREMMACIVRERRSTLRTVLHGISVILNNPSIRAQQRPRQQANYCTEVTSEGMSSDEPEDRKQFCRFKRTYSCGDVVQIQLSTSMKKGTLSPVVQLFNMTPKLDICLEHRNDPIHSFAKVANERTAILRSRRNIVDYQRVWRNLLGMVSANGGVAAGETVTIHDVKVKWSKRDDCSNTYEGIFSLPATFCINRHIRFHTNDLACIRYHTNCDDDETAKPSRVNTRESTHQEGVSCWTAHCVCTEVENLKSDKKRAINEVDRDENCTKIHVILHQSKTPMPEKLLKQNVRKLPLCTIEWIPIGSTDRHIATGIEKLPKVSVLVQDICLGQKITAADNRAALAVADTEIRLPRRPFYKLNPVQDQAVKTALCKPFTLIQGPPGTGKTVTGVHIAYWFVKMNQQSRLSDKDQVLYCGPSNKAVDVVTAYLKKIVPAIKILRVYGESIEHQSFPVPWMVVYPLRAGGNRITMSEEHRDVALHFLIRQPSNKYHAEIKHFDSIFRESRHSYNREDKSKYLRLISEAEKIELDRSDVILCTCAHSGTDRIAGTRIRQCIVDECGMCTEPETVLPLVTNQPQQVVLVGDHKQLRPIVTEDMAKKLGMEISLLERYEEKAMMLTLQYRMHPGICQFPSDQFYQKRLETAQNVLERPEGLNIWPGGHEKPVVFCHIVGTEERQTVSTAEGGEQSRSNMEEVEQVVRMAITLVVRHLVNPASILIISQYRAQCSEITKRLKDKGHPNITVSTVIVSQGSEWDYVLFSTVRSLPRVEIEEKPSQGWLLSNLGFITDEHQINVAITRAKLGLIIVGNKELLITHGMWKQLLQKYEQDGCLVYAREFLQLPVR